MTDLAKQNTQKISRLVSEAYELIRQAEALADEAGLSFNFDVSYGMGGTYVSEGAAEQEGWKDSGWHASSHSC